MELKQSFSQWDEIAETIAAFSTNKGGKVFVGIDRNGLPIGTNCNNEIKGKLQSLAHNELKPPAIISVELVTHDAEKVIAIIDMINLIAYSAFFSFKISRCN